MELSSHRSHGFYIKLFSQCLNIMTIKKKICNLNLLMKIATFVLQLCDTSIVSLIHLLWTPSTLYSHLLHLIFITQKTFSLSVILMFKKIFFFMFRKVQVKVNGELKSNKLVMTFQYNFIEAFWMVCLCWIFHWWTFCWWLLWKLRFSLSLTLDIVCGCGEIDRLTTEPSFSRDPFLGLPGVFYPTYDTLVYTQ